MQVVSEPLEDGSLDTEAVRKVALCLGIQPAAPGTIISEKQADGTFRKKLSWRLNRKDADRVRGLQYVVRINGAEIELRFPTATTKTAREEGAERDATAACTAQPLASVPETAPERTPRRSPDI